MLKVPMEPGCCRSLWRSCYHNEVMIKAVFFDLYGTLAGFSPSRYEIQSSACADFGVSVTPEGILRGYALADAFIAVPRVATG